MSKFEFIKKDDTYIWENEHLAIEFSNPSVQGFEDFTKLTSENQIMYYYYLVQIYRKFEDWDDDDNEFVNKELVSERYTHDFPTITQLKWILEYQLNNNDIEDCQRIEYESGKVHYSKTISTEGFACDDFYEIRKFMNDKGGDVKFIVYAGTTYDCQGDLNSSGIRTPYVNREDIEQLLQCVNEFIQYSLDKHNENIELAKGCYEAKHNKLYEYLVNDEGVQKDIVESIFAPGDNLDITTVVENREFEYYGVQLTEVTDTIIHIIDDEGCKKTIDIDSIVFISSNITNEKLSYNEQEIVHDFVSILTEEELNEFKSLDSDVLLGIYKLAIIHRTAMCRDEHQFDIDYRSGDRVNTVTPIVKNIIESIKRGV